MVEARAGRIEAATDALTPALRRLWEEALATPIDEADRWLHGDLHARNVLVEGGRLTGVIDWSDLAAGDRATDLAAIWGLFDAPSARERAMRACTGVSEATWMRARGWAFAFGVMLLDSGMADHPRHAAMGADTLRRLALGP
jgi:aminoglycoside phosphotransferase (APT) family kinase protein